MISLIDYTLNNKFHDYTYLIFLEPNAFSFKCPPFNLNHFGCPLFHPIDCLLHHHLRDGPELPLDGGLQLLQAGRQRLVDHFLQVPPQKAVTGVHIRRRGGPAVPPPGPDGQHPLLKDAIKPLHDHVGLVWLCPVLLPDGQAEEILTKSSLHLFVLSGTSDIALLFCVVGIARPQTDFVCLLDLYGK